MITIINTSTWLSLTTPWHSLKTIKPLGAHYLTIGILIVTDILFRHRHKVHHRLIILPQAHHHRHILYHRLVNRTHLLSHRLITPMGDLLKETCSINLIKKLMSWYNTISRQEGSAIQNSSTYTYLFISNLLIKSCPVSILTYIYISY